MIFTTEINPFESGKNVQVSLITDLEQSCKEEGIKKEKEQRPLRKKLSIIYSIEISYTVAFICFRDRPHFK